VEVKDTKRKKDAKDIQTDRKREEKRRKQTQTDSNRKKKRCKERRKERNSQVVLVRSHA
jgi:hypothetical protein